MRTVNSTTIAQDTLKHISDVLNPAVASGALTNAEAMRKAFDFMYSETAGGAYQAWGRSIFFGKSLRLEGNNCLVNLNMIQRGRLTFGRMETSNGFRKVFNDMTDIVAGLELIIKADNLPTGVDILAYGAPADAHASATEATVPVKTRRGRGPNKLPRKGSATKAPDVVNGTGVRNTFEAKGTTPATVE